MAINDHAQSPVPNEKTVSGWHIGLIYIGVGLTLPAFLLSATLGQSLGFTNALLAVLTAGCILTVIGMATAWIGGKLRLSTYLITQKTFGIYGALALNLLMGATAFGWFGITISLFAQGLDNLISFPVYSLGIWSIIGGCLMTATAVWGFKGLDKLSLIAVPVLLIALAAMIYQTSSDSDLSSILDTDGNNTLSFGVAVSMMVGAWMVGATILPDISRYAKTPNHGSFGAFLCFIPGLLLVMGLSMIPAFYYGDGDFVSIMIAVLGPMIAAIVIGLASWSSNDNNLYSSSLALASIFKTIPKWMITIAAGATGTILSLLGIMDYFMNYLMLLGIFIPPIAGAYCADYYLNASKYTTETTPKTINLIPLTGWAAGSTLAYSTTPSSTGGLELLSLTTVSAMDGLLVAAIVTSVCSLFQRKFA